jgi:hypothetical protein
MDISQRVRDSRLVFEQQWGMTMEPKTQQPVLLGGIVNVISYESSVSSDLQLSLEE